MTIVFIPMFLEYFGRGDRDGEPHQRQPGRHCERIPTP